LAEAVARQLREIEELRLERQVQDELRDGFSWKRGAETKRSVVAEAFEQERHEPPRHARASTTLPAAPRPPQREKSTPPPRPGVDRECRPEEPDFIAPRPLAAAPSPGASRPQVLTTGLDVPSPKVLDRIHDVVLEGGVVALPTETGYVLACDATNRNALTRLRAVAALPDEHPLMLMVQNLAMVQAIVRHLPRGLDTIFEDLWPGPLAVRFRRPRALFQAASPGDTIVLRYSPSPITGLLLDLIVRPLAVLDAGPEGDPLPLFLRQPCFDSATVRSLFGANLDVLLDAGVLPESRRVTVLAAQESPYVLEFEGAIARQRIEGRLNAGEQLAPPPTC
jgi:tRNA threonylcarbamoyl adenosine modification protein (Sua5/YciO/YrdC/YwlC family)